MPRWQTDACLTVAMLLMVLGSGCGSDGHRDTWNGTVDTLDNGAVIVSNPITGVWDSVSAWRLEPVARIGSVEGDGAETFSNIIAFEIDVEGRIYVLDRLSQEIRVLSPDGEHIRTVGRDGEGPGEFRGANGLGWGPNGRLWVVDQRLKRYSVFDTSGTLLDSHQAPMSIRSWEWSGGFTRNGILYDRGHTLNGDDIVNVLLKFDMAGEYSDTFPLPLYQAEYFQWRTEYGPNMKQVPYSPLWVWMLAPDGDIRAGSSDDYRIHHLSLQADTLRIIKREYDPIPVTDAEREAAIEDVREFMRGRQFDADRVPMAKPAFERFTVDDSGFLWVKLPDSPVRQGSLVDVFDPEGRFLGTMVTSAQMSRYLRFIVRGDVLCYVTVDELDVPYVVTERITGR